MKRAGANEAAQLESFIIKQLLTSSGAFKGNGVAGSGLTAEMFADTLADAIAGAGGMGLAPMMTPGESPAPTEPQRAHFEHQTSSFGIRVDPFTHQRREHHGVDLAAPEGTPIPAAKTGVVIQAGERGGYGNAIEVQHADGTSTLYAHASALAVVEGAEVKAGQTLGFVGHTGRSTGPHLHLEVRKGGKFLDPQLALKAYRLRAEKDDGGSP